MDLLDPEERHKDENRAGAALPGRQAERVGVGQPGGEEASSLLVPEGGLQMERGFPQVISVRTKENGFHLFHLKEGKY